ncbi:MAG: recombinase family protein [Acetobacteraceae bacterium]|nr:recombinase family protein [Acetobacteraceae bacterium]
MQVAAYARVSTRRQTQAQTIEQQLDRLRAHAAARGWELAQENVFRDDGHSGASLRRPGLDHLRDAAAGARLDRILITTPDRLARNYVHQVLLVEELQGHGAAVEFLDRPMGRDPHDQLLLQIRGAVAEYERTLIAERMRRGRLRKLRAGVLLPWTRPPYGYRLDPERPRDPAGVRLDEAEAAVVRDLFAWFVDEGVSVCGLARRLRGLGVASPWGLSSWCLSAVRRVLTNPVYFGQVFANRLRTRPIERRRSALRPAGRTGESRRVTDPAEWIAVATVPAIVDRERFERAQERLAYSQRMAARNNRVHEYLLRGLVSCGHCRRACAGRHVWRGYDYYVCRTRTAQSSPQSPGGEHCPTRHIPGGPLEELVWRDLCEVLAAPAMIAHAMERARGGHWLPQETQARRANLRRARAGLHQQIERLTDAYLAGVVPLAEYQRRRRDAEGRLSTLDGQERELTHGADRQAEAARLAAHAEAFCRRVRQGLEQADFRRKRELLELLIDRVVVTGETVEIRYAVPVGPEGEREPFCRLRTDYQARFSASRGGCERRRGPAPRPATRRVRGLHGQARADRGRA